MRASRKFFEEKAQGAINPWCYGLAMHSLAARQSWALLFEVRQIESLAKRAVDQCPLKADIGAVMKIRSFPRAGPAKPSYGADYLEKSLAPLRAATSLAHKLIYALIWPHVMLTFNIVHRRRADCARNYVAPIEHGELND